MRGFVIALAAGIVLLSAASVFADDTNPPNWRGPPGSTFQEWEFSTSNPVTAPDVSSNPYGVASAQAYPGTSQNWVDEWGGRQGMWPLSGTIEATIPNSNVPNPYKDIWVQITWAKQVGSSAPDVWEMNSGIHGTLVENTALGPTGYPSPNDLWYHSTYQIRIYPNPASEIVKVDGTLVVDELVIDTICVPEPSGLIALAVGAVGMVGVVRRKRR